MLCCVKFFTKHRLNYNTLSLIVLIYLIILLNKIFGIAQFIFATNYSLKLSVAKMLLNIKAPIRVLRALFISCFFVRLLNYYWGLINLNLHIKWLCFEGVKPEVH